MTTEKIKTGKKNHTYIINGHIKFVPSIRTLEEMKTGKKIKLYVPASLCLDKLLQNQGHVLSQYELIQCGWGETRESSVSTNNFYQCILHLRKNFAQMGVFNLIETIPRHGIILNDCFNVAIKQGQEQSLQPNESRQIDELDPENNIETPESSDSNSCLFLDEGKLLPPQENTSDEPADRPCNPLIAVAKKKAPKAGYLYILITVTTSLSLFFFLAFTLLKTSNDNIFEPYTKLKSDGCSIYANDTLQSTHEINDTLKTLGLPCLKEQVVFFTRSPMKSRINIIHCTTYTQKKQDCRSLIINEPKVTP